MRFNPIFLNLAQYLMLIACDFAGNIFHVAENRYILQNNINEFRGTCEII
jgi:hypothetical protein